MKQCCPICDKKCDESKPECERGEKYIALKQSHHGDQESELTALFYKLSHLFIHRGGQDQAKNRVLAILLQHGDMTQRELLDHMDIRSASLSELLKKVEANGDIVRERNQENARHVDVRLTDKGKTTAKHLQEELSGFTRELFAPLNGEERDQLKMILIKLILAWKGGEKNDH